MRETQSGTSDVDVDLQRLAASLLARWRLILLVAVLAVAAAFVLASMATPLYQAETRILIETRESAYTRTDSESDRPILDEEGVTSQVEVIASSDILRGVARDLGLAGREEFQSRGLRARLGLAGDPPDEAAREAAALAIMRDKLSVYRVENSRVIVIGFSSADPQLAAAVPNAIADDYIEAQRQANLLSNAGATEWLAPEIADLRERVREAEARVASFRSGSDLLIGQNNATLSSQQLSELSSELSRLRASRSAAEARAQGVRAALEDGRSLDAVPEVLASPVIQRLREREVQLNAEIAELSTTLLDNHPRLRGLRSQLADLSPRIRVEARNILESLENQANVARQGEAQLQQELDRLKVVSGQAGEEEVELRALQREAAAQRALLESYLTRYREASARADRNYLPVDARVFSRAQPPVSSYYPKFGPIIAAAFAGSLLLMTVFTLLSELLSGRAMRPAPGAVHPVPHLVMPAAARLDGDGPRTAEHAVAHVAGALMADGITRAVFLSPEGEAATAASVMVAREVSDAGLRVLFLDLTSSGTPSNLMLESRSYTGITNLLASEAQFTDTIHGDLYSDCHVIPVGTADARRAMRAADRLPIILTSLTTAYDLVVIECGPATADSVARVTGPNARILIGTIEEEDASVKALVTQLAQLGHDDVRHVVPATGQPEADAGRTVA